MASGQERENAIFGRIIRQRRMELGLTQEELAERVGESVRQSDISRMERGYISLPRRERLEALAEALDVTPGFLLMHSGWAGKVNLLQGSASEAKGDTADRVPRSVEQETTEPEDAFGAGQRVDQSSPGAVAVGERQEMRPRHEQSARLTRARQDVLAANRELTRAIQALTDEHHQEHDLRAGTASRTGNGHARDEELEALRTELQAVVEELIARNDNLEARSLELRAAVLSAEHARVQFSAIMNAVGDNVVVVDQGQAIVLQSKSFSDLIGGDLGTLQFRDEEGRLLEGTESPLAKVARGESFSRRLQVVTPRGGVQSFEAVGRPSGVVKDHRLGILTLWRSGE